jgi:hypothetical protein
MSLVNSEQFNLLSRKFDATFVRQLPLELSAKESRDSYVRDKRESRKRTQIWRMLCTATVAE